MTTRAGMDTSSTVKDRGEACACADRDHVIRVCTRHASTAADIVRLCIEDLGWKEVNISIAPLMSALTTHIQLWDWFLFKKSSV